MGEQRPVGARRLCAGRGAGDGRGARSGTRAAAGEPQPRRGARGRRPGVELYARWLQGGGGESQGVYPRGRHLSGGAVAALVAAVWSATICTLPIFAPDKPVAFHVLF